MFKMWSIENKRVILNIL